MTEPTDSISHLEKRTLAILVNTSRYPTYVSQIAKTAHQKGISVHVHYSGRGVLLAKGSHARQLENIAEISICRDSCAEMGLVEDPEGTCFVSPDRLIELLQSCTRTVVF